MKESCYHFIFNTQFNLHFQIKKKCKSCDLYEMKTTNTEINDGEKAELEIKQNFIIGGLKKPEKT